MLRVSRLATGPRSVHRDKREAARNSMEGPEPRRVARSPAYCNSSRIHRRNVFHRVDMRRGLRQEETVHARRSGSAKQAKGAGGEEGEKEKRWGCGRKELHHFGSVILRNILTRGRIYISYSDTYYT
eukprot:scaffold544_cov256-Pinguiococcus_pyrenoidosus.AAC.17